MSIETWKKEFYPIEAADCSHDEERIDHSIRKWVGLLPENLERHGLKKNNGSIRIYDELGDSFIIGKNSCSLCVEYIYSDCSSCPIFKKYSKKCFYKYHIFEAHSNPNPMIELLKNLKEE